MTRSSPAPDLARPARSLLLGFLVLSPVVFWYSLLEPFESVKSTLTQLAALALLVLGVVALRGRSLAWTWDRLRELFAGPVGVAILVGVGSAVLSTVCSISPRTSWQGTTDSNAGLASVLALTVLFAASRVLCAGPAHAEQVTGAVVVGTAIACGYAMVQALGGDPVGWEQTSGFAGWLRPSGTQGHPNYLAGHVVMVVPLLAWLVRNAIERGHEGRSLAAGTVLLLAGGTILVSLSRAAWLAGVVVVVVLLVGWKAMPSRRWCLPILSLVTACVLAVAVFGGGLKTAVIKRIQQQGASAGRRIIWTEAVAMFRQRPWAGSGVDTFRLAYPLTRSPEYWEVEWGLMPTKAHDDFLHALATQGLPGGIAYLSLPAALVVVGLRRFRENRDWMTVLLAVVAAFYVQNLVGFSVASTSALLAVVAGVIAGKCRSQNAECRMKEGLPHSTVCILASACGIAFVLAGLWLGRPDGETWRVVVTATALVAAGAVALVATGARFSPSWTFKRCRFSVAVVAPACVGLACACYLLCPVVASHLSFRGENLAFHEQAVRLAPGHPMFHVRHANAQLHAAGRESDLARRERLLRGSLASIETACRLEPLSANYHADRAGILFEMARRGLVPIGEVLAAYDRSLALDRCDWRVVADAARAATTLGCFADTERYLAPGLASQPNLGMLHAERGALALAKGNRPQAETILWEARQKEWHGDFDRFDRALLLLALTLLQRGDAGNALVTTREVLDRHADWPPAAWLHAQARAGVERQAPNTRTGGR